MNLNPKTLTFGSPALNLDDGATTYDTAAFTYSINGVPANKAAVSDGASVTTQQDGSAFTALTAGKGCVFAWFVNIGGTVSVIQSDIVDLDGGNMETYPQIPHYDADTYCLIAVTTVKADTGASAWTFGSSNWNAANVTAAVNNVSQINRPYGA